MKPQDRIKILKEKIKKKENELDDYIKETKKRCGEIHTWAYDEHYQGLCDELYNLKEGLKKYRLALRDLNKGIEEAIKKVKLYRKNFMFQDDSSKYFYKTTKRDFKNLIERLEKLKK